MAFELYGNLMVFGDLSRIFSSMYSVYAIHLQNIARKRKSINQSLVIKLFVSRDKPSPTNLSHYFPFKKVFPIFPKI